MDSLRIVVCVKQVPESSDVRIDPETYTLKREGVPSIVNPFDSYAIEEALRIKERLGGKVTAVTMGPPQAATALKDCIALGVDDVLLLSDRAFAGADTLATAYTLASAIAKIGYDIILCGKQATDGDTAQVGPGIAVELDIPHVTYVRKIAVTEGHAVIERLVEGGYERVETSLPALFTVVKEINEPRLPSLRGKMRARNASVPTMGLTDLQIDARRVGLTGSPTQVIKVFTPEMRTTGETFTQDAPDAARLLVSRLKGVLR